MTRRDPGRTLAGIALVAMMDQLILEGAFTCPTAGFTIEVSRGLPRPISGGAGM